MIGSFRHAAVFLLAVTAVGATATELRASIPAPEWVGIYDVQGKAGLLWIKSPDVRSYRIYRRRSDENAFALVGETDANRFTDANLQPRITYYYRLVGLGKAGLESTPSAEASFTLLPKVKEAVTPPVIEGALVTERGIGIKWAQADPSLVVAFNVYRVPLPDGRPELLGSTRETSFTDHRVEQGREYRYWITALDDSFKETAPSESLTLRYEPSVSAVEPKAPPNRWTPQRTFLIRSLTGGVGRAPSFRSPTDVAYLASQKLLFVADSGNGLVQVFGKDGDFRYDFPIPPSKDGAAVNPLGLALDREGRVYVSDAFSGLVHVFHGGGKLLRTLEVPRLEPGEGFGLLDVSVSDSRVFVADNRNRRVAVFDVAGKFIRFFGDPGLAPPQFSGPSFSTIDSRGRLLVSDPLSASIKFFGPGGEFLRSFGRYGRNVGALARPKGVAVDAAGRIYVADSWLCQVQAFDEDGTFLFALADEKGNPLDLGSPNGIAVDAEDNIYIAERLANRVQIRHLQTR